MCVCLYMFLPYIQHGWVHCRRSMYSNMNTGQKRIGAKALGGCGKDEKEAGLPALRPA